MSENTKHKISGVFIRRGLRRVLSLLIAITLVFAIASPFISDAYAKKRKMPKLTSGLPFTHWLEVMDFNPHYGSHIPPWILTIPVPIPLPSLRLKVWCGPPVYIFGFCMPFPDHSWCNSSFKCGATNAVNLIFTLLIKHAKPATDGRPDDLRSESSPPDYYTRDACVSGSRLDFKSFDPKTGNIKSDDERYGDKALGLVAGAKPFFNTCAPMVNTPKFDPPVADGKSFAYYQNAANDQFKSESGRSKDLKNVYGTSNGYLSTTFPIEGFQGCPKEIFESSDDPLVKDPPTTPAHWKARMEKCYDYFILSRAPRPEWTLERTGYSTDDLLTKTNPDLALFNSCQPLMDGNRSKNFVENGVSDVKSLKFSPVLQYNRADLDEADYDFKAQMERSFRLAFPNTAVPMPVFQNIFPCVENRDGGPVKKTYWSGFNTLLIASYGISFGVEFAALKLYKKKKWFIQFFRSIPEDIDYKSPGGKKDGFCPNVEKINVPTHPFAPRDDIKKVDSPIMHYIELRLSPYKYNLMFDNKATEIYATDREYSYQTSWLGPEHRISLRKEDYSVGYSDYSNSLDDNYKPDPEKILRHLKYPEVMCAIVPVDILEPRRKAFDSCIMQRINYNFLTWRRRNFLSYYYKHTLKEWEKPCATRFYESDSIKKCPVSMSIQQCCRIIVKDVVPMNYVKIRTCEGLRQKRRLIFGFDHIYDAADSNRPQAQEALAQAQYALEVAEEQYKTDYAKVQYEHYAPATKKSAEVPPLSDAAVKADPRIIADQAAIDKATADIAKITSGMVPDAAAIAKAQAELDAAKAAFDNIKTTNPYGISSTYMGYSLCRVGPNYGLDPGSCDTGHCHGGCNTTVAALSATLPAIRAAEAKLATAKTTFIPMPAPVTITPVDSPGGVYMDVVGAGQQAYDLALAVNQKLALIGCDDTEPDNYRFSHYFHLSTWADKFAVDTSWVNESLDTIQQGSDDILRATREEANNLLVAASTSSALAAVDAAKATADSLLVPIKLKEKQALTDAQNAQDDCRNAQMEKDRLGTISALLTASAADYAKAVTDVALKCPMAAVKEKIAQGYTKAVQVQTDAQYKALIKPAQDTARKTIKEAQDIAESEIIIRGKEKADDLIIKSMETLAKTIQTSGLPTMIDEAYDATQGNVMSELAVAAMGEGGAHMPYMRWWDTGTSAGNPVHGGSFINTLGSYDTVVGVGHEERNFYDVGGSTPVEHNFLDSSLASIGKSITKGLWNGTYKGITKSVFKGLPSSISVKDGFSGALSGFTGGIKSFGSSFTSGIDGLKSKFSSFTSSISSIPTATSDAITAKVNGIVSSVSGTLSNAVPNAINGISSSINNVKTNLTNTVNGAITTMSAVPAAIDAAKSTVTDIVPTTIDKAQMAYSGLSTTFTGIINSSNPIIGTGLDGSDITISGSSEISGATADLMKARVKNVAGAFAAGQTAFNGLPTIGFGTEVTSVQNIGAHLNGVVDNTLGSLYSSLSFPSASAPGSVGADSSIGSAITSYVLSRPISAMSSAYSSLLSSATSSVKSAFSSIMAPLTSTLGSLKANVGSLFSTVRTFAMSASPDLSAITTSTAAALNSASVYVTQTEGILNAQKTNYDTAMAAYKLSVGTPDEPAKLTALTAAKAELDTAQDFYDAANAEMSTVASTNENIMNMANALIDANAAKAAAVTPEEIAAAEANIKALQDNLNGLADVSEDTINAQTNDIQSNIDALPASADVRTKDAANALIGPKGTLSATGALSPSQSLTQRSKMGRIGGWAGLKGHQMWTMRRSNLSCIGRYEKLFKQGEAENFVLSRAGTNYVSKQGTQWPWPLSWRGYINDPENEFEKHLESAGGLDNAQKGDIIIYKSAGLKKIAYVSAVNKTVPQHVVIESWDNGKFPTASGAGVGWGNKVERTIYKDEVPENAKKLLVKGIPTPINVIPTSLVAKIGENPLCEDPGFTTCVLGGTFTPESDVMDGNGKIIYSKGVTVNNDTWEDVEIFRPINNIANRQCPFLSTEGGRNIQTPETDTDTFTYCINSGFDPPKEYLLNHHGAGTGAINDATLCGPKWTECSTVAPPEAVLCFPGGERCDTTVAGIIPPPPPPPPPPAPKTCDYDALAKRLSDAETDSGLKDKAVSDAEKTLEEQKILAARKHAEDDAASIRSQKVPVPPPIYKCIKTVCVGKGKFMSCSCASYIIINKAAIDAAVNFNNLLESRASRVTSAVGTSKTAESVKKTAYDNYNTFYTANSAKYEDNEDIIDVMDEGIPTAEEATAIAENDVIGAEMNRLYGILDAASDAAEVAVANVESARLATYGLSGWGYGPVSPKTVSSTYDAMLIPYEDALSKAELAADAADAALDKAYEDLSTCPKP